MKLVTAFVGAVLLSLVMAPTSAIQASPSATSHPAVVVAHQGLSPGFGVVASGVVVSGVVAPITTPPVGPVVGDLVEMAIGTASIETASTEPDAAGDQVKPKRHHSTSSSSVEVSAVSAASLGSAVATDSSHKAYRAQVTAVNTATLGTAVAVNHDDHEPKQHRPKHHDRDDDSNNHDSNDDDSNEVTSNVTAVNTGILGKAVAVGSGSNGNTTAVNTGILGTAVAIG